MPSEVRMTIDERLEDLRMRQEAYAFGGNRKRRGQLLDEVEEVTGEPQDAIAPLRGPDERDNPLQPDRLAEGRVSGQGRI